MISWERLKTQEEYRTIVFAIISGIALIFSFFDIRIAGIDLAWIAVLLCGYPIVKWGLIGLWKEHRITTNVLITIALIAAIAIGELFAAGEVAFIMALGEWLEERTVKKAQRGIEQLVKLTPQTARILRAGEENVISVEDVRIGDRLRVLPGETVPVDGRIISGRTAIDQSLLTGESLPQTKEAGDDVFTGTQNQEGAFIMEAVQVRHDTSLQRMIRLVETADAQKTPTMRIMDRWASWIVILALTIAVVTWIVTGEWIRAVTVLIVFCPCSLVLATPVAITAGIGNATRYGMLVSKGDALERLSKIKRVAFDKTGTLTVGKPAVVREEVWDPTFSNADVLSLAASAEQHSEHPLGRAVLAWAQQHNISFPEALEVQIVPGRGIQATVKEHLVRVGNRAYMAEENVFFPEASQSLPEEEGQLVIYIGVGNRVVGAIILMDVLRDDAKETIDRLHKEGTKTILLTGDRTSTALHIAKKVGIDEVHAELLPAQKVDFIQKLQQHQEEPVCMVGDGLNDAPALKTAFVGVAMGNVGSDITSGAADVVLVQDDIVRLPYLLRLGKKTARMIRVNILFSILLNVGAVTLAAAGWIGPVVGALLHNGGALIIILNSMRLLKLKDRF